MKVRDNPIGFLIMLVLTIVVAVTGCGPAGPTLVPTTPTATPATTTAQPAPIAAAAEQVEQAPDPASTSEANAVAKAQSYLDYSAFSRTGLIEQLKFEGFSGADATYGVDHLAAVDWNVQAAKKAESYLRTSAFSHSGLLKQLKFEGFTAAQAEYGVKSVGL